jgi:hypothetical protein
MVQRWEEMHLISFIQYAMQGQEVRGKAINFGP